MLNSLKSKVKSLKLVASGRWTVISVFVLLILLTTLHRPLTTAQVPPGVDPHQIRLRLLNEYNIEIAGGFGALKDKVWRIGLMGHSATQANVDLVLAALVDCLE